MSREKLNSLKRIKDNIERGKVLRELMQWAADDKSHAEQLHEIYREKFPERFRLAGGVRAVTSDDRLRLSNKKLQFGTYADVPLKSVPLDYLNWIQAESWNTFEITTQYLSLMECRRDNE